MKHSALYPELIVKDIARSSRFYVDVIGFDIKYSRPEEHFRYLSVGDAQLMLLEDDELITMNIN